MIWWILLLFAGGMVLVLAEFLLPGGLLGAAGACMLIASAGLSIYHYPDWALVLVPVQLLGAGACVVGGMYLLSKKGVAPWLKLGTRQSLDEGWVNMESDTSLVGKEGTVYSALRPAGAILVGGERIDAVSDGSYIDKGTRVRVIEVHGNRIVVEPCEESAAGAESPPEQA